MQYTSIIETAGKNFSAYAPDLPGCITTGQTEKETLRNMREAIEFHIGGMRQSSEPIPKATAAVVDVAA